MINCQENESKCELLVTSGSFILESKSFISEVLRSTSILQEISLSRITKPVNVVRMLYLRLKSAYLMEEQ